MFPSLGWPDLRGSTGRTPGRRGRPAAVLALACASALLAAEAGPAVARGGPSPRPDTAAPAAQGAARDGTFTRLSTTGPRPSERSTPAVGALDGSIYVFGGVKDDFQTNINTFYQDLYRFEPGSRTWEQLEPAGPRPAARAFAAGAGHEVSRRLFVYGGASYGPFFAGFVAYDDLWAYDVSTGAWAEMPAGLPGLDRPLGRSRPNLWTVGDRLYMFGGVTATFQTLNDLWVYDLDTRTWTELIPHGASGSPPSRHEAQAGTIAAGGRLTLYGGEAVDLLGGAVFDLLPDTWELDLATLTWHDETPAPPVDIQPPRNYGSAAVIGDWLLLHGGDVPGGTSGCGAPFDQNPVDELWRFDIAEKEWKQLHPAGDRARLKRTAAAAVARTMYIFSGFDFVCEQPDDPGQVWNLDVFSYERRGGP